MTKTESQYIGACALLAKISERRAVDEELRSLIRYALDDCCRLFPDRFEYWGDELNGYHFGLKRREYGS